MKKRLSLITLFIAGLLFVSISLLIPKYSLLAQGPAEDPPSGDVIPTFSGLKVTGDATIDETLYVRNMESPYAGMESYSLGMITISDPIAIAGTMMAEQFYTQGEIAAGELYTGDAYVFGKLDVTGDISSNNGAIGSYYTMQEDLTTGNAVSATCKAGDYLTGCGGYSQGVLKYSYHTGNTCYTRSTTNTRTIAKARCFDPQGVRTGVNP